VRRPSLDAWAQNRRATPEVVVLVEAAEVGHDDEDVLAINCGMEVFVRIVVSMRVADGRGIEIDASALGHVVAHELREAVGVVADADADGPPWCLKQVRLVATCGPIGLRSWEVQLVVAADLAGRRDYRQAVVDGLRILVVADGHAEDHVQPQLLGKLCNLL